MRLISFALAVLIMFTAFPMQVFAEEEENNEILWEQGTIASVDGTNNSTKTRFRTADYLLLESYSGVSIGSGYTMTNFVYDAEYNYLGTSSWLGDGIPFTTAELSKKYPSGIYFRVVFRTLDQRNLTEEDVISSGVKFYLPEEEVPAPDFGFTYEDIGKIGTWQDGDIHDGKLFVFGAAGSGEIFDLRTLEKLGVITLDKKETIKPHANSVCFGSTYYEHGDKYPLLYINIYNNYAEAEDRMEGTCCVYRLLETEGNFSTELVQVIKVGFTDNLTLWKSKENNGDVRPYGNFVVDTDENRLYAFVMRDADKTIRFFEFAIPEIGEGTYSESYGCNVVTLETDDIKSRFDSENYNYLQGCCYYGRKIFCMCDFGGDAPLHIIDLEKQKVVESFCLGYAGLRAEPEVICVDDSDGTLYYCAVDGMLRKIVFSERIKNPCGPSAFWKLENGVLKIYGSGEMEDYADAQSVPWRAQSKEITSVVIEEGITSIGSTAFAQCENLVSANLPEGLEKIGKNAFWGCTALNDITLPQSLEEIGQSAFFKCSALDYIVIPSGVKTLEKAVFGQCENLDTIVLHDDITAIESEAFSRCYALRHINLPKNLKKIGYHAFFGCAQLEQLTFPETFAEIEDAAFYGCYDLAFLRFMGSAPLFAEKSLMDITANVYYPDGDASWEETVKQNYGGNIIWNPECYHNYKHETTEPTCTEQGYTTHACTICGESYVDNYTEPTGHTYKNGICTICGAAEWDSNGNGTLEILAIGNSFSWDAVDFWYDMQNSMTYNAMKSMLADKYDVHLAVMYKGSATLAYHATCAMNNTAGYTYTEIGPETDYQWTPSSGKNADNKILEKLEAREWDIIVIQSYQHEADGTEPRSTYTGGDARFKEPEKSVGYLLDYFVEHEPDAEVYYYMPWATTKFYGSDTVAGYSGIAEYSPNYLNMKGTNSGKQFAGIIPVGTGIQNARTTYFDALEFSSGTGSTALLKDPQIGLQYDVQHLSFGIGRYIAGVVMAETLIPQSARKDTYTLPGIKDSPAVGKLPEEYSTIAKMAAMGAVESPYQVTVLSGYEKDPADRICDSLICREYAMEGIADEEAAIACVQSVVNEYLKDAGAAKAMVKINSFEQENGVFIKLDCSITVRVGYTERTVDISVVDGKSHVFGEWTHTTVPSADGVGIDTRICKNCGFVETAEIEGSWQKFALADHLQKLPDEFCSKTNLWNLLIPEKDMINHLGDWVDAGSTVYSVTIPVLPGDRIYANSFDQTGSRKGIQVSFIGDYGIIKTTFSNETYNEFHANGGYLVAPEGTVAVNIPVWNNSDENELYILNREHSYDNITVEPTCTEEGYSGYLCIFCGVGDKTTIPATDHSLGEWYLHKAPTTSEAGEERRDCANCDYYESREVPAYKVGDINRDGKVNTIDANYARRYAAGLLTLDAGQKLAGDVNLDGEVNVMDSAFIRRHTVKLINVFPAEEAAE